MLDKGKIRVVYCTMCSMLVLIPFHENILSVEISP